MIKSRVFRNVAIGLVVAASFAGAPSALAEGVNVGATVPASPTTTTVAPPTSSGTASSATTTTTSGQSSSSTGSNSATTPSTSTENPATTTPPPTTVVTPLNVASYWPPTGRDLWWYLLGCLTTLLVWLVAELLHTAYRFAILKRKRSTTQVSG